ncbi:hypothetical protein UPYG_G00052060 [Umbra pygmaea]|uniref:Afadin- and alpha-actinin-binding protein-like n=1 Tax=Umbra pygmaea TaxID=75934 RepID=A0ABD0XB65_UMBPY
MANRRGHATAGQPLGEHPDHAVYPENSPRFSHLNHSPNVFPRSPSLSSPTFLSLPHRLLSPLDLHDTYVLHGEPSLPLIDHSATWWAGRDEQKESISSFRDQLSVREQHVARLQNALRREREKSSSLQSQCNQQGAELKRREQHNNKLRERLAERQRERGASMELLNPVPRGPVKRDQPARPARANGRREEAALRAMLERREAELREAMKLRHKLTTLLHALRAEMEQTLLDAADEEDPVPGDNGMTLVQSEQSLGDHVTGGVVQGWKKVKRRLRDFLNQGDVGVGTDQDKLLAQLQTELVQSQQLVREQQQLLQDSVISTLPDALTDSYFLEDWERLQAQGAELELQRRSFQRERWAFTDAAIRLGRERHEFEQQKACVIMQQYLSDSLLGKISQCHSRESTHLGLSGSDHVILSSCPVRASSAESSVAPWLESPGSLQDRGRFRGHSPSTPDLFSALKIPCASRSSEIDAQSESWHDGAGRATLAHSGPRLDWSF